MKSLYSFLIIISSCLYFSSCKTKITKENLQAGDDKIFVQSFLNPNAEKVTVGISVARGVNASGKKIDNGHLSDATVIIRHAGVDKHLNFEMFQGNIAIYAIPASELPIIPGEVYHLSAFKDGIFEVESSTNVPGDAFHISYTYEGPFAYVDGGNYYKINVDISDDPGINSVYRTIIEDTNATYYYSNEKFYDDKNGTLSNITYYEEIYEYAIIEGAHQISVAQVNEDTYEYMKSVRAVQDNDGNPFAEPTSLKSNITGGLGIFGAMVSKKQRLHL